LGDLVVVRSGFAFRSADWADEGVPVVKIQNVRNGRVDTEKCSFVPTVVADAVPRYRLRFGDVLITMSGEIGAVGVVRSHEQVMLNQRVGRFEDIRSNRLDSTFLLYSLSHPSAKSALEQSAYGVAQANISPKLIEALEVPLPPLTAQRKIAAILSAYDDLIENNTRRIKLLKEMAHRIYREWFVDFRYPGHENVPVADSELGPIPHGWSIEPIGNVTRILGGGTPSKTVARYWDAGTVVWYTPTDLTSANSMFMTVSKMRITAEGLARSSAKLFPAGSVMMTSRATIGVVAITTVAAATNQGFITCPEGKDVGKFHLYFWLHEQRELIVSLASGATFKEINRATFRRIPFLRADDRMEHAFEGLMEPIGQQIQNLLRAQLNLRSTRDLLLPRLISGEIDVTDLDIALPEIAA
jgi:type I restriction enzyme, S subunit